MEQTGTHVDDLLEKVKSSYDLASLEEKKEIVAQLDSWVKAHSELMVDQAPDELSSVELEAQVHPLPGKAGESRLDSSSPSVLSDLSRIVENEFLLQQIAENIEQAFWLSDFHSERIIYVSPAFQTIWGRTRESLYANPQMLIESVHPEDRVQVLVAKPHIDHKSFNQAYRIIRPDGSLRWVFTRTFLLQDKKGAPEYVLSIAEDITDQKGVEQTLRKTLDHMHEQFNLSRRMSLARKPQGVLKILMSAYELRSAKRATLVYFDQPKIGPSHGMEMIATWVSDRNLSDWSEECNFYEEHSVWDLLKPDRTVVISGIESNPRLLPIAREFLLAEKIQTLAIFPLVAMGDWVGSLLVFYKQEHLFDRFVLRQLKVLVDQASITLYNLKLLEVEAESRHEAERANEIKTEFLAMITHELRTPLTSIIGFTTTLLAQDVRWEPAEQRDFIQTILQEADRLNELIVHLLDLSRLEAGMLPILISPVSIQDIIEDALPQFNALTNDQTLKLEISEKLPPINADKKRISQVLVNLVRNSATYSPKGTEITISTRKRGNFVQVSVNDQGPGIPSGDHKRVFRAFQRGVKAENSSIQGAGLGLAICKGLVEAHGGHIWIAKKMVQGASICFTIPLVTDHIPSTDMVKEQ
jgi:PAS domain S-box-containing protein